MKYFYNYLFKYFFIALPFLYAIMYAPFGFESYDTGFILGLSWQFISGSVPYSDIIYVRPPVSYFFHSLFFLFNNDYTIIIDRVFFYFEVAIYSYLTIVLLAKKFEIKNYIYIYFLSSISFILSVHTFPAMAWHTVDGIFFCVLGIFLVLNGNRNLYIFIGGVFLILGALSKQPFLLIPIFILGKFTYQKEFKKLLISTIGMVSLILIFCTYLIINDSLSAFINQVTGQTKLKDLIDIGIISFVFQWKSFLLVLIVPAIAAIVFSWSNFKFYFANYFYILLFWILTFSMYIYINNDEFTADVYSFADVLFILTFLIVLIKTYITKLDNFLIILLFLIVSWTSSISWGYATVVLFSAPMVFILSLPIYKVINISFYKKLSFLLLLFGVFTFYVGYQNPYKLNSSSKKSDLIYEMDNIYPKLKYIYGDEQTYLEYQELKKFISKYDYNFTVLPGCTLIHFLSNTKNPIGIDWVLNAEVNNQDKKIIHELESNNIVVFVLKKRVGDKGTAFGSDLTDFICDNWQKVEEGNFYDVYRFK